MVLIHLLKQSATLCLRISDGTGGLGRVTTIKKEFNLSQKENLWLLRRREKKKNHLKSRCMGSSCNELHFLATIKKGSHDIKQDVSWISKKKVFWLKGFCKGISSQKLGNIKEFLFGLSLSQYCGLKGSRREIKFLILNQRL